TRLDAMAVGIAAWRLGAGRAQQGQPVQAGAGVQMHAKPGDEVRSGQRLFTLHTDTPDKFEGALQALAGGWEISAITDVDDSDAARGPLILQRIGS
ncbi:MAG: thymidine phosphorylase, partial [Rhodococcus sp. (in: high G+C Gram-positive bacteria)]